MSLFVPERSVLFDTHLAGLNPWSLMRRFAFDQIDSTNERAKQLAQRYPGRPLLVTARKQTAGRGRLGRSWMSPAGGAWLSVLWPMSQEPDAYACVPLVAAVGCLSAVEQAIQRCEARGADSRSGAEPTDAQASQPAGGALDGSGTPELSIKWPNDVLANGRKVAGVLCEQVLPSSTQSNRAEPITGDPGSRSIQQGAVVVGVGINADFDPALLPRDLRWPATTLRAVCPKGKIDPERLISDFAEIFEALMNHFEAHGLDGRVLAPLRASLALRGRTVDFSTPNGPLQGRVLGVDEAGQLELMSDRGVERLSVGEIESISGFSADEVSSPADEGDADVLTLDPQSPDREPGDQP